jgi:hypothetical protein
VLQRRHTFKASSTKIRTDNFRFLAAYGLDVIDIAGNQRYSYDVR